MRCTIYVFRGVSFAVIYLSQELREYIFEWERNFSWILLLLGAENAEIFTFEFYIFTLTLYVGKFFLCKANGIIYQAQFVCSQSTNKFRLSILQVHAIRRRYECEQIRGFLNSAAVNWFDEWRKSTLVNCGRPFLHIAPACDSYRGGERERKCITFSFSRSKPQKDRNRKRVRERETLFYTFWNLSKINSAKVHVKMALILVAFIQHMHIYARAGEKERERESILFAPFGGSLGHAWANPH